MIQVLYTKKKTDKSGNIKSYILKDLYGNTREVESKELKFMIKSGEVNVLNLKLTKDDRLIDSETGVLVKSNIIFGEIQELNYYELKQTSIRVPFVTWQDKEKEEFKLTAKETKILDKCKSYIKNLLENKYSKKIYMDVYCGLNKSDELSDILFVSDDLSDQYKMAFRFECTEQSSTKHKSNIGVRIYRYVEHDYHKCKALTGVMDISDNKVGNAFDAIVKAISANKHNLDNVVKNIISTMGDLYILEEKENCIYALSNMTDVFNYYLSDTSQLYKEKDAREFKENCECPLAIICIKDSGIIFKIVDFEINRIVLEITMQGIGKLYGETRTYLDNVVKIIKTYFNKYKSERKEQKSFSITLKDGIVVDKDELKDTNVDKYLEVIENKYNLPIRYARKIIHEIGDFATHRDFDWVYIDGICGDVHNITNGLGRIRIAGTHTDKSVIIDFDTRRIEYLEHRGYYVDDEEPVYAEKLKCNKEELDDLIMHSRISNYMYGSGTGLVEIDTVPKSAKKL